MNIIINMSSMIPIYEQIVDEIKKQISHGSISDGDALPSVRGLAKDLKISALTVKKAYDELESEGLVVTIHGKGSYIKCIDGNFLREECIKEIETGLDALCQKAKSCGITEDEIREILDIVLG